MGAQVSRKLVEGVDTEGDLALFIVEGNPDQGYDLYRARLEHVEHYKRSWQAVEVAHSGLGSTP
jgi:hypothetical protein